MMTTMNRRAINWSKNSILLCYIHSPCSSSLSPLDFAMMSLSCWHSSVCNSPLLLGTAGVELSSCRTACSAIIFFTISSTYLLRNETKVLFPAFSHKIEIIILVSGIFNAELFTFGYSFSKQSYKHTTAWNID